MRKIKAPKGYTVVYRGESTRKPLDGRPLHVPDTHWHKLPSPLNDSVETWKATWPWWCGCTRKKDIFKWWYKRDFDKHPKSFEIRVFIVPKEKVIKGNTQCIFDRKKAKRIGTLNVDGTICPVNNLSQLLSKTRKEMF